MLHFTASSAARTSTRCTGKRLAVNTELTARLSATRGAAESPKYLRHQCQ